MLYPEFTNSRLAALAYDLPDGVKSYKYHGDFAAEIAEINAMLARGVPAAMRERLELEKILAEGMMQDYSLTPADALAILRRRYPDLPDNAMETILATGYVDWRLVNGELHLQDDAPANIRKTLGAWLSQFRAPTAPAQDRAWSAENVPLLRQKGERSFRFRIREALSVDDEFVRPGEMLTVHLPYPAETETQREITLLDSSHEGIISNAAHRTICFTAPSEIGQTFFVEFSYLSTARYTELDPDRVTTDTANAEAYLAEQYPHIRFTPYLRALAAELAGNEPNPLLRARRFYDYITQNVRYSYTRDYRIIDQLAEFPALNLRGDCGLQAILFITLCRISGIPARWRSGSYVTPDSIGSHDWAEFYAAPYGWLPCDPSFGGGALRGGEHERCAHYFGNLDPYRLVANTALQADFAPPKRYLRIDPYDNQSGEAEYVSGGLPARMITRRRRVISAEEV
ncbi:MAG: transglutaminase domain-containing protein [Clostridia bacterium]|nr:transglutaminase domain-containing protein [Clostridia bacterium]